MQRITRARLVLSLALVGALALAGCGGGDDAYSISAEDQARIDTLTDDVADCQQEGSGRFGGSQQEGSRRPGGGQQDGSRRSGGGQAGCGWTAWTQAQSTIDSLTAEIGMMPSGRRRRLRAEGPAGDGSSGSD